MISRTSNSETLIEFKGVFIVSSDYFLGYPREVRGSPPSDTSYSCASRSKAGPYARAAGNYARYGDVLELLRALDDQFAVFGSGEGVRLEFDPRQLPATVKRLGEGLFLFR